MPLQSMTGFARSSHAGEMTLLAWEVRSVNSKGLEMRFRLPPGLERLEHALRQAVSRRFSRGSINATLSLTRAPGYSVTPVVNEAFLKDVAGLAQRLQEQFGVAPATADGLLALRGVLEIPDGAESEESRATTDAAALASFDQALDDLAVARAAEGEALARLLHGHLDTIETLTRKAEGDPSRDPEAIRAKLAEQVRLLLETSVGLDEARLATEAAFLATRVDIREEIDRLYTHVASARALLAGGGAIGRKLDFLSQEFIRESNTLCSKSNAAAITSIGLDLKGVVDQFREQVQNLE
jgi:uncharacterized protein (TIGR00255 family)